LRETALVTASAKKPGIGYVIARKLALCGTNVVIADLKKDEGGDNPLITVTHIGMQPHAGQVSIFDIFCDN